MTTEKTEKKTEPFVLDASAPHGVGRVGTLQAAPADIIRAFGPANVGASGDNKVDREWCFRSRGGHGVSLYAYKATSLYCSDDETPSPSEFWAQDVPRDLSVGGPNEHVGEDFIAWAQAKIAAIVKPEPPQAPTTYMTTFCNFAHDVRTGRPIDHECYCLNTKALEAERDGDYDLANKIGIVKEPRRMVKGRKIAAIVKPEPPQAPKRCATCGSYSLRVTAWVWLNSNTLCKNTDPPTNEVWCEDCEDETEIAE